MRSGIGLQKAPPGGDERCFPVAGSVTANASPVAPGGSAAAKRAETLGNEAGRALASRGLEALPDAG
jgi:hypothetical protein